MATKKDLVEAYSFSRRRLVTAFISGAPGGREVEPARPGRTIVGGLALAVLLIAGAAIAGIFAPRAPDDWASQGLVLSKEDGNAYVILEDEGDPVLRPVINITLGQADPRRRQRAAQRPAGGDRRAGRGRRHRHLRRARDRAVGFPADPDGVDGLHRRGPRRPGHHHRAAGCRPRRPGCVRGPARGQVLRDRRVRQGGRPGAPRLQLPPPEGCVRTRQHPGRARTRLRRRQCGRGGRGVAHALPRGSGPGARQLRARGPRHRAGQAG